MDNNISFYEIFYYNIIKNKIEDYNNKILIIIDNYFNPFDFFTYIIKKFNIKIYIVIDNKNIYKKILDNIRGEEYEQNINVFLKINDINDIFFDKIFIFHIFSIDYMNNLLKYIVNISDIKTMIYIYSSLSNENNNKINYKNYIRDKIMAYLPYKMGYLISFSKFLNELENNKEYKIDKIQVYKKNNYLIYGDNTVYEIMVRL